MKHLINIAENDLVACICEGATEATLINLLLDKGVLGFSRAQLLGGDVLSLKYRDSSKFQNEVLTLDYEDKKIIVIRIQDRVTPFRITSPYNEKVKGIYTLVTKPEIEIMMVTALGLQKEYQKRKVKPSLFLQEHLKINSSKLKSKGYIETFYETYDIVEAIRSVKRHDKEHILADILKLKTPY